MRPRDVQQRAGVLLQGRVGEGGHGVLELVDVEPVEPARLEAREQLRRVGVASGRGQQVDGTEGLPAVGVDPGRPLGGRGIERGELGEVLRDRSRQLPASVAVRGEGQAGVGREGQEVPAQ